MSILTQYFAQLYTLINTSHTHTYTHTYANTHAQFVRLLLDSKDMVSTHIPQWREQLVSWLATRLFLAGSGHD